MKNTLLLLFLLTSTHIFAQKSALKVDNSYIVDIASAASDKSHLQDSKGSLLVTDSDEQIARTTHNGGMFSYKIKVDNTSTQLLVVQYSGDNKPKSDERILFDIEVNGTKIYTEGLNRNRRGLFEVTYSIPDSLFEKKTYASISFKAHDYKSKVGEVYSVAIVRKKCTVGLFADRANWTGLDKDWSCASNQEIAYHEPDGPENPYSDDSVIDFLSYYALDFDFKLFGTDNVPVEVIVSSKDDAKDVRSVALMLQKQKDGTCNLRIPLSLFDTPKGSQRTIRRVKTIALKFGDTKAGKVKVLSAKLLEGNSIQATTPIYSKAAEVGETITYPVMIKNCESTTQRVQLAIQKEGWEAFPVAIEPSYVDLASGQSSEVALKVTIPPGIPVGSREKQVLQIVPLANPTAVQQITFTTLRSMPHPFTIHTADGWEEVREKAKVYDWAAERKSKYLHDANRWHPPHRPPYAVNVDGNPYLCATNNEHGLMNNAINWQLTRDMESAKKVKQFLLMISNYENGFPITQKASNQASVQEGHFFQHLAQAYDLIKDANILSEEECSQIEYTFRLYIDQYLRYKSTGGANWAVSQLTGVFFCALAIQDFQLVDEVLYAPSCLIDKFRTYTMPDGWWYECTVSYNLWVASQYIQMGLALEPFGYSLLTDKFPVDYNMMPEYEKMGANELHDQRNTHHGHSFRIRGPIYQPYVTIKMMSDALLPFLDYRGWIFGINDATEREVGGDSFELAYYAFRDSRYAPFIKMTPQRDDLLYGVAELPDTKPANICGAYADNAGALMLRSTQEDEREKIQAVLKYGTHGGYHGHFDRTALLSLMRYGRSFYNPEMVWYSYAPYMYNFYVQTSISKNMVTVDLKQQEADASERTLFHTGELFQAGCVEGSAAWSYPAYGGLRHSMSGPRSFKEKTEWEARYFPSPQEHPEFGVLTDFTEPIFQRRLMVVTDDYVLLADYNKSTETKPHRFDLLFQIKGLLGITATTKEFHAHQPHLSTDSLGASMLVTDVNNYLVTGTMKASFLTRFGSDADNRGTRISGEPGNLYMDVYNAWPNTKRAVYTGRAPEEHGTQRMLKYQVQGDDRVLAEGQFGAWILGDGVIDVNVEGVKELTLSSAIQGRGNTQTLFWAEALLETKDGRTIPLSELVATKANVFDKQTEITKDYADGRININGSNYRWGLPAEPDNIGFDNPAEYSYDLSNLGAVRLKTVIGGDYPVGDEAERRITLGVRTDGSQASYLTVVEPYEKERVIESVTAPTADSVIVTLKDGREHRFYLSGLEHDENRLAVKMEVWESGKMIREERTE